MAEVCERTELSTPEVERWGVDAYSASVDQAAEEPYEVFRRLDPGPGGYAIAPARQAKQAVGRAIRDKHGR